MVSKIRTVIIDDETDATDFIRLLLAENCPDIEVSGIANTAIEAIKLIQIIKPDLVLLDIEMPNASGFDVLEALPDRNFIVIFITAYDRYAIKAFKYSAFDYIMKPIDIPELVKTISNVIHAINNRYAKPEFDILIENLRNKAPRKLAVPTGATIEYIDIDTIIHIEADKRYSTIYTSEKKYFVSRTIGEYQDFLEEQGFFRAHNSFLININHVKSYVKSEGGYIIMDNDAKISISRRNRDRFIEIMSRLAIK